MRRIVASMAADTCYGELFDVWWPDAPHRVLRTRLVAEWGAATGQRPGEGTPIGTILGSSGHRIDRPRYAPVSPGRTSTAISMTPAVGR